MANIVSKCDFCDQQAVYDAKTVLGPWAYLCQSHYNKYGDTSIPPTPLQQPPKMAPTKICRICGVRKPVTEFYQYKDRTGCDRYRGECITCNLKQKQARRKVQNGTQKVQTVWYPEGSGRVSPVHLRPPEGD